MKTEQERIDYVASRIRNFKIVVGGDGHVEGGFGRIPSDGVTIDHLEKSFNKFRLQADFTRPEVSADGMPVPVPPPPTPPVEGACCDGEDCTITTEEDCAGTYQGDGTVCDPNPCIPACTCYGFAAYDGSDRYYLTETTYKEFSISANCGGGNTQTETGSLVQVRTYDPDTCELETTICSGSLHIVGPGAIDCVVDYSESGGVCNPGPDTPPGCFFDDVNACCDHFTFVVDDTTETTQGVTYTCIDLTFGDAGTYHEHAVLSDGPCI